ncbi:M20 family metallopeptidase [Candidatus Sumerlaeota bacterium]|nr:M20 family metallopeptidase [Candidatus Sumerlaeota bacterium]
MPKSITSEIDPAELLRFHAELIRINSVGPGLEGCEQAERPMMRWLTRLFEREGVECWQQEVQDGRNNILARIKGSGNRTLLLEAHMDVVSTRGMTIAPFDPVQRDGRVYGRGSCDTKGAMACMLAAMLALRRSGETPPANVVFCAMVGEETDFEGAKQFAADPPVRADAAIIGEPTNCRVVSAHKGGMRYYITTRGVAAHGAMPELGVNAIENMARVIRVLREEIMPRYKDRAHPLVGPPTINIGLIEGGTQVNFVPDYCRIMIDQRITPGEDLRATLDEIAQALRAAEQRDGAPLNFEFEHRLGFDPMEAPNGSEIVRCCLSAVNQDEPLGVAYGTDGSFMQATGMHCVLLGPGDIAQAHAADEWIEIAQLQRCAGIYLKILQTYSG